MKTTHINLHFPRKKALLYVAAFLAFYSLLAGVISISTNANVAQIHSLMCSDYAYSATAQSSSVEDAYYQFNAGIAFSLSPEMQTGLNLEVVMQTENAHYTDLVYWNTDKLSGNGVAISENIADANDLQTGDKIYSKHIVDGKVREYTIENILPVITHVRGIKENSHYDGVLVMGYDDQYASNITHKNIIFTKEPIEMLALQCSAMPEDIVYRSDEISAITKALVPYLTVYILAAVACVIVLTLFLTREVAHNFRRFALLGFDRRLLNKAYHRVVWETGAISIATTAIVSAFVFSRAGFNLMAFMPVICAIVVEVFTLSVAAIVSNWRLWRK